MEKSIIKEDSIGKGAKKVNNVIMKKLGWIGVFAISAVYIFWGFFAPRINEQSLLEVVLSSGVSMLVALAISNLLSAQGIMSGSVDQDVVKMKDEHISVVNEANEYVEYSDEWTDMENKAALITARKHILMSAGLKYADFFNSDGDYLETAIDVPNKKAPKYVKARYAKKQEAIKKALSFKVTPVTMAKISAETTADLDPNKLDKEPDEFQRAKMWKSIWQKIASVAIFGQITWKIIEGADFWQSLFNGAIQLVVFFLFGILSFYISYIYMTNTYVGNLRKKINLLKRLIAFGKKKRQEEVKKDVIIQPVNNPAK